MTPSHHVLIAGTGRAGTSLLVRVLEACGLETQIAHEPKDQSWSNIANAGLESDPLSMGHRPYVIKSPWMHQMIGEVLQRPDMRIDAIILPVRNLAEAVASRVILELKDRYASSQLMTTRDETWNQWGVVPGGVLYSLEPIDQARSLAHGLHRIIEQALDHDVPLLFLKFPRFVSDVTYLYRSLFQILPAGMTLEVFKERVEPLLDGSMVRIESELGEGSVDVTAVADGLPSFEELDRLALKRELKAAHQKISELSAALVESRK